MAFVASLHRESLSASTVKSYLSAVRYAQIALGLGDPGMGGMAQLEYVVKGMKRLSPSQSQRKRLPITPPVLGRMKQAWASLPDQRDTAMLWAAATLCFFGFLRSGEIVVPSDSSFCQDRHLSFEDIRVDSHAAPQFLEVRIKESKTDPFRKGVTIVIGRTGGELCPVAAVLGYMAARGPAAGPLFHFSDGRALTRARFVAAVRVALTRAGVDAKGYSGHSFRIGAATTAAQRGMQDSLIKTLGRWESSAYTIYIRTPREVLQAVSGQLVRDQTAAGQPPAR